MFRDAPIQQRRAEIVVAFLQCVFGVSQFCRLQPLFCPLVARPEVQCFLKAEHALRVVLVVVALPGVFQIAFGARGQRDAFRMREVLANRILEFADRSVSILGLCGHRLQRNVDQFSLLVRGSDFVLAGSDQAFHHVFAGMRRNSGDAFVQHGPHQIDVTRLADPLERPCGHFRCHVGRRAAHVGRRGHVVTLLEAFVGNRQSPIHHQDFAVLAQHGVFRFQVAVDDAPRMREGHGVRSFHKDLDVLGQGHPVQAFIPRSSLHSLHRIEQRSRLVGSQVVDRHDVGMVQIAGDHGFGEKLSALRFVAGRIAFQHFDRDGSIDGGLSCDVHNAHTTFAQ